MLRLYQKHDTIRSMRKFQGRVREIRLERDDFASAWIDCPAAAVPAPGQYVLAHAPADVEAPLAVPLFLMERAERGFWSASPTPVSWGPGTVLEMQAPSGRGFRLEGKVQRLALVALGQTPGRLFPLVRLAQTWEAAMTLFTDLPLPAIPAALEAYPLSALAEVLAWPDLIALDLPIDSLPQLRHRLGLKAGESLPCPAQALIYSPMPCGGLADCGVCAVPGRWGWKLVCMDGPVFNLDDLDWK